MMLHPLCRWQIHLDGVNGFIRNGNHEIVAMTMNHLLVQHTGLVVLLTGRTIGMTGHEVVQVKLRGIAEGKDQEQHQGQELPYVHLFLHVALTKLHATPFQNGVILPGLGSAAPCPGHRGRASAWSRRNARRPPGRLLFHGG